MRSELYKTQPLQDEAEIQAFAQLLADNGVKSYLEIGSKFGGSLWRVAHKLQRGSRLVSVDLKVNGPDLQNCIDKLNGSGYDAWLIPFNSTTQEAIERAEAFGPYDAIFIDGDHRPPGVWADWNNYSPLGRIIAFHDIGWKRAEGWVGKRIDVVQVWDEIKVNYRYQEIKLDESGKNNGIGVLWRS